MAARSRRSGTAEPAVADQVAEQVIVYLGNRAAIEAVEDPDDVEAAADEGRAVNRIRTPVKGKRCTTVVLAPGTKLMDAAYEITHATRGVWKAHSDADAPAWVASTDPALAQLLADHYGAELRDPEPDHGTPADAGEQE
jgi:hypothetical protein